MTSPAGLRTEANIVLPAAFGPGLAGGPPLPGPKRAARMSPGVRGAGGMSATAASSAIRLRDLRRSPGSSGQPEAAAAAARAAAAFAVAGRSAPGSTGNADPSAVSSSPVAGSHGTGRREAQNASKSAAAATASSSDCRLPRWIAPCALTWAAAWPNGAVATAPALRPMIPAEYDCCPQFNSASCGYRFSLPDMKTGSRLGMALTPATCGGPGSGVAGLSGGEDAGVPGRAAAPRALGIRTWDKRRSGGLGAAGWRGAGWCGRRGDGRRGDGDGAAGVELLQPADQPVLLLCG